MADPELGLKPLLAKLREQQPELGAATREVREALKVLEAEGEANATTFAAAATAAAAAAAAAATATAAPPAVDEGIAPPPAALSLACIGCYRLPSDMDDGREKHPICDKCRDEKLPTIYLCGDDCPANPVAWELHGAFHKELKKRRKWRKDGGVAQQRDREAAERLARHAAQTGDEYDELIAEGMRYVSKEDWRRAARTCREAIALRPDEPVAYFNLGNALNASVHYVEASQRYLEAKERYPVGSELWARATASAFDVLRQTECDEVAKPEWWNDEGLKALSARVVRKAPNDLSAIQMRAMVLSGRLGGQLGGTYRADMEARWPRSAADHLEAATHYERVATLCPAPEFSSRARVQAAWSYENAASRWPASSPLSYERAQARARRVLGLPTLRQLQAGRPAM